MIDNPTSCEELNAPVLMSNSQITHSLPHEGWNWDDMLNSDSPQNFVEEDFSAEYCGESDEFERPWLESEEARMQGFASDDEPSASYDDQSDPAYAQDPSTFAAALQEENPVPQSQSAVLGTADAGIQDPQPAFPEFNPDSDISWMCNQDGQPFMTWDEVVNEILDMKQQISQRDRMMKRMFRYIFEVQEWIKNLEICE